MTPKKPSIDISQLLAAEYAYIAQTAAEAHEDRARVSSFYLVAVGSLVAAIFGAQVFDRGAFTPVSAALLGILFTLLTFLGTSTIIQLARLRQAWYDSMKAMNKIKEFAMKHNPELEEAFLWKSSSLPKPNKKKSISFYQVFEVSVISGLMLGAAIFFFLLSKHPIVETYHWIAAAAGSIALVMVELIVYKRFLE
jgi:hypothetical protein